MDLQAVIDSMADGVFICDAEGKLTAINRAALRTIGAKDLAQANSDAPRPFRLRNARQEDGTPIPPECMPMRRALSGEEVVHEVEVFDVDGKGTVMLRTRTTPIRDRAGRIIGAVKIATDITREHELEGLKEDFIRVAAHELKTPVTVIKANAEAVMTSLVDIPPTVHRLLQAVNRGADRIDRLVSSLLDLVELQGGFLSISRLPVRLDRLLEEVVRALPPGEAARVRLAAAPSVSIKGDRRRLRKVLRTVIDNALKYSPDGSAVEASIARRDGVALVSIVDHGIGIPFDKKSRVFEKFFRAHAGTRHDVGGIGVGLFIAREVIAQHGGRIWFDTVENRGTSFHLELPAV